MAIDPSTPPEPQPLIENGVTTSEWRLIVRYAKQLAAAGTAAVVAYVTAKVGLHLNLPPEALNAVVSFEVAGAIAVVGYALSRGIRKAGATNALPPAAAPVAPPAAPPAVDPHPAADKPATQVLGPATAPTTAGAPVVLPGGIIPRPPSS